ACMTLVGQAMASVLGNRFGVVPIFTLAGTFELLGGLVAFILLRRASHIAAEAHPPQTAMALDD
ncbi:MAG: hypothetical protein M3Y58_11100, partial [Chloroflexota bacterium]|nr:hypothetical protein [Chloroflexota bacterium]